MDDVHNQVCNNKFPRITTTNVHKLVVGQKMVDDEDDSSEAKRMAIVSASSAGNDFRRFCGLPSSRIVRVSRASGGKDRHSKVWTSKGLRDRRVRLSVSTAIQFYDLQDRLGYDQPSKAVEWLLRAAESSISELPSLNHSFVDTPPKQLSDEMRSSGETIEHGFESNELEMEVDLKNCEHQQQQQQQHQKSACSSTSETSKGSGGFVVSRSDNRVRARERARGRAVEKAKNSETAEPCLYSVQHQNLSHNASFTELLTGNVSSGNSTHSSSFADLFGGNNNNISSSTNGSNYHRVQKQSRQWHLSTPMDHFLSSSGGYSGQVHMGNSLEPFSITSGDPARNTHHHHHQFSFVPDNNNLVPLATAAAGGNSNNNDNYNLNFTVSSSGLAAAGYNRGTLQSNSPSMLPPHLQRFAAIDGSNVSSSYISPGATKEGNHQNHHQFVAGIDGPLQLYYGDANWHSDHKGKGKN